MTKLEERVERSPGSPAFARLADFYRIAGNVDKAIGLCEKGIQHNPEYPTGHLLLGRCYYEKERIDDAKREFLAVLKSDQKNIFALKIMGDISAQAGKREEAAHFYKRASDFDPLNGHLRDIFRQYEKYFKADAPDHAAGHPAAHEVKTDTAAAVLEAEDRDTLVDAEASIDETALTEGVEASEPAVETAAPAAEPAPEAPAPTADISEATSFDDLLAPEAEAEKAPETEESPQEEAPAPEPEAPAAEAEIPALEAEPPPVETEAPVVQAETPDAAQAEADTEMVDLPSEMLARREERVGDFKVRRSLYDRLMAEQDGLMDALAGRPAPAESPVIGIEPSPGMDESAETDGAGGTTETVETGGEEAAEPAANPDGFYSVTGEAPTGEHDAGAMTGLDEVEMEGRLDDDGVEAAPAPVSAPAAAWPEADQELRQFVQEIPTEQIEPEQAQNGVQVPEAVSAEAMPETEELEMEAPAPAPEEEGEDAISSSAAGMDGFYNVEGSGADQDVGPAAEMGTVEMEGAISDDGLETEIPESVDGAAREVELGTVELGNEVDLAIPEIPAEPTDAPPPAPAAAPAPAPAEKSVPAAPDAEQPEPLGNAKELPRVVSNVATESLAEIYLRQGYREQSLAVYRKMLEQKPDNKKIMSKIQKLEDEIRRSYGGKKEGEKRGG